MKKLNNLKKLNKLNNLANPKKQKKIIIYSTIFLAIAVVSFFTYNFIAKGATYGWLQATWNGGADTEAVANHTSNQSGWTKFFSKDDNISTADNQLTLIATEGGITETDDEDFNAGTTGGDWGIVVTGGDARLFKCGVDSVTYSGTVYPTVIIGTQCWMAKNLNIGTRIARASNQTNNATLEKYCYADNEANCTTYGGLYQWDEAMQYVETEGAQGICPTGWHIPTDAQQYTLENYLKDSGQSCVASRVNAWDCSTAGGKMKEIGTTHWTTPNTGATNSSGFTVLPAGYRDSDGSFYDLGSSTNLWSSSVSGRDAWRQSLDYAHATVFRSVYVQAYGFSVRCLKD